MRFQEGLRKTEKRAKFGLPIVRQRFGKDEDLLEKRKENQKRREGGGVSSGQFRWKQTGNSPTHLASERYSERAANR